MGRIKLIIYKIFVVRTKILAVEKHEKKKNTSKKGKRKNAKEINEK